MSNCESGATMHYDDLEGWNILMGRTLDEYITAESVIEVRDWA